MSLKDLEDTRGRLQKLNSTFGETHAFLKSKGKTIKELTEEEMEELKNHLAKVLDTEIESRKQLLIAPTPKTIN